MRASHVVLAAGLALAASALAAEPYKGEVEKVDAAAGKVTLKHGPIAKLDMDAMTMGYRVADPSQLKAIKAGDKVIFDVGDDAGAPMVTKIEKAK